MDYQVTCFCFQDTARRAHSVAAQGGVNACKNYKNDGDTVFRMFYDTIKGGDFRSREANVYRLAECNAPELERDYYPERRYPAFGNLCPRDIASRAAKERIDAGYGIGPLKNAVYLDFSTAIREQGKQKINGRAHGPLPNTTTCQLHMRTFKDGDPISVLHIARLNWEDNRALLSTG